MSERDAMQVCKEGHLMTASYHRRGGEGDYCDDCGSPTLHECPECGTDIPGEYYETGVIYAFTNEDVPSHCKECGSAFPWEEEEGEVQEDHSQVEGQPQEVHNYNDVAIVNHGRDVNIEGTFNQLKSQARAKNEEETIEKLEALEAELNSEETDMTKVQELKAWINKNAQWAAPSLATLIAAAI